jgi:pyruvate dehydrogenase E2 component (dihydrolipoamide acetyltransferase)
MAITIVVPRLGWSMDEGTFVEWLKADGAQVRAGDPLFVLESDKATESIEAIDAGILRIPPDAPQPGTTVKVGQVLAFLVAEGETTPLESGGTTPLWMLDSASASNPVEHPKQSDATALHSGAKPAISPRARRVARALGIEWHGLSGSGRGGRIRERDVRATTASAPGRLVPHTRVRRIIAARMAAGVTQAAPVTLTTKADVTCLVALRAQTQSASLPDNRPGYGDYVLKLTARTLPEHPMLQGQWRDVGVFVPDRIHIAIAVDTPNGLLAPVVRDADRMTVPEIAARRRELTRKARDGTLTAAEMSDATFTISNLGMFGIDAFTPIVHLPQCAILGVGRIVREPCVIDDKIVPRDMLSLSLTFDHRVVDGAPAARFLNELRRALESAAV